MQTIYTCFTHSMSQWRVWQTSFLDQWMEKMTFCFPTVTDCIDTNIVHYSSMNMCSINKTHDCGVYAKSYIFDENLSDWGKCVYHCEQNAPECIHYTPPTACGLYNLVDLHYNATSTYTTRQMRDHTYLIVAPHTNERKH